MKRVPTETQIERDSEGEKVRNEERGEHLLRR